MTATSTLPTSLRPTRQSAQLHDLWQSEEQLAWRVDAWLIKCLRAFPTVDPETVSEPRRYHIRARQALRQRVLSLGRAVVRLPFVGSDDGPVDLSQAARELQMVHHELIRARDRTEAALFAARRDRDYSTVNVLTILQESHRVLIGMVREIFMEGQRVSRAQLVSGVA